MKDPVSGPGCAPDRGPARASRATLSGPGLDEGAPIVWPAVFRLVRSALRAHGPTAWGPLAPRWFDQILDAWIDLWSSCAARANRHWDMTAPLDLGLYASACLRHAEVVETLTDLGMILWHSPPVIRSPITVVLEEHMEGHTTLVTLTITPPRKEVDRG